MTEPAPDVRSAGTPAWLFRLRTPSGTVRRRAQSHRTQSGCYLGCAAPCRPPAHRWASDYRVVSSRSSCRFRPQKPNAKRQRLGHLRGTSGDERRRRDGLSLWRRASFFYRIAETANCPPDRHRTHMDTVMFGEMLGVLVLPPVRVRLYKCCDDPLLLRPDLAWRTAAMRTACNRLRRQESLLQP